MNPIGQQAFGWRNGLKYGALGLPLAFVALPLYVLLPNLYATSYGLPLALLGTVLLLARLFDAVLDPVLGRWIDSLYLRSARVVQRWCVLFGMLIVLGFAMLFLVPSSVAEQRTALLVWLVAGLLVTYLSYSVLSVSHQAWAARLGGSDAQRSQIVSWREGLGLLGVVLASILPSALGFTASVAAFSIAIALGLMLWMRSAQPLAQAVESGRVSSAPGLLLPFANPAFVRLFVVFVANGIASAIPATLLLFFVQDRLQLPVGSEGPLLALYFVCAAGSIALWVASIARWGLECAWLGGMLLNVAVFVWAMGLGAGDHAGFAWVCALSGLGLGADLCVPSALLARVIAQANPTRTPSATPTEGIYFGWWNFAAKLNLALAAGLALPALAAFGYAPGVRDAQALQALTLAYCLLPCLLKLAAAGGLWFWLIRPSKGLA